MGDPFTLGILGLGVSVFSAVNQYESQSEARDAQQQQIAAQRDQAALENRRADIINARQLRNSLRQARIARAAVINAGATSGTLTSSGVVGGAGSISSQYSGNAGYFGQQQQINDSVLATQSRQADAAAAAGAAQGDSAMYGVLGALGGTIFSNANGFKTIFGGNVKGPTSGNISSDIAE